MSRWGTAYFPRLDDDEVHIWFAHLDDGSEGVARLMCVLSEDERQRAARFRSRIDAHRWAVSRIVLRSLLGRYLRLEPRALSFQTSSNGKPEVAVPPGYRPIEFNMSHSDGLGLYALARSRRVGIDVERLRWLPDLDCIAERIFAPDQQRALRALPEAKRPPAFFRLWTREEAYLKATGQGLGSRVDRREQSRWLVMTLPAVTGYAASLAIEGRPSRLRFCSMAGSRVVTTTQRAGTRSI